MDHYLNLNILGYKITCPYFENTSHKRDALVFVGKGLPYEIESATKNLLRNSKSLNAKIIKSVMIKNEIGIDCSGLAMRIEDALLEEVKEQSIRDLSSLDEGLIGKTRFLLRPYTNVSADMITSKTNTVNINDYNYIEPGDLIRAGKSHVGVVTGVSKGGKNTKEFEYIHSLSDSSLKSGVRMGTIKITNPNKPLENQKWFEKGFKETMLSEFLSANSDDRGIRRLKILA